MRLQECLNLVVGDIVVYPSRYGSDRRCFVGYVIQNNNGNFKVKFNDGSIGDYHAEDFHTQFFKINVDYGECDND